jgi:hypothetical protein
MRSISFAFLSASLLHASGPVSQDAFREENPFYVKGEFLFWKLVQAGQDFVASKDYFVPGSTETTVRNTGSFALQGTVFEQKYGWEPGFRLAAGYHFPRGDWTVSATYTAYNTLSFNRVNRPEVPYGSIRGTNNTQAGLVQFLATATSKTQFHYRLFNVDLETFYRPLKNLEVRLSVGAAEARATQFWKSILLAVDQGISLTIANNQYKWKYRGFGMTVGGAIGSQLGAGFNLEVNGKGGAFYGPYQTRTLTVFGNFTQPALFPQTNVMSPKLDQLAWLTQLGANLSWSYDWKSVGIALSVGYEANILQGINSVYSSPVPTNNGGSKTYAFTDAAINLQGLNASASLAY